MDLLIFDQDERFVASVGTEASGTMVITDEWDELHGTLRMDLVETSEVRVPVSVGMFVAFFDLDGAAQMFEVRDSEPIKEGSSVQIKRIIAEHVRYEMINDPIEDRREYNVEAAHALETALSGTRWRLGRRIETALNSTNFYYESAMSAISKIQETWGVRLAFRIEIINNAITDRVVDMVPLVGRDTGKRFEYGKDLANIRQRVSLERTATALYGRGKAVQVSENGYGRKSTFADAVWLKAGGSPADKPAGQEWVGDEDARAAWGRGGRHRFGFYDNGDIEDPEALLEATWAELQKRKEPEVSYDMTVLDLEALAGCAHEAVRMWDQVRVIDKSFNPPLYVTAEVIEIKRSQANPLNTKIRLGNYAPSIVSRQARTQIALSQLADKAGAYDRGIWQDTMDVMSTQILSSGTRFYTSLEDGSFNFESDDGSFIVKITGSGILMANSKTGGEWNWRTAITSGHLVIDEQTVGQLNAGLVKILGTGTYLDGTSLVIQHPSISAKTVMDTGGMRMYVILPNGTEQLIGGLYTTGGRTVNATNYIVDPNYPRFAARIGALPVGEEGYGIELLMDGAQYARIALVHPEGAGAWPLRIDAEGEVVFHLKNPDQYINIRELSDRLNYLYSILD